MIALSFALPIQCSLLHLLLFAWKHFMIGHILVLQLTPFAWTHFIIWRDFCSANETCHGCYFLLVWYLSGAKIVEVLYWSVSKFIIKQCILSASKAHPNFIQIDEKVIELSDWFSTILYFHSRASPVPIFFLLLLFNWTFSCFF